MDPRAVNEKEEITMKKEANVTKLKMRKKKLEEYLLNKRNLQAQLKSQQAYTHIKQVAQEEMEEKVEESGEKKGYLCLSNFKKKKPKTSKKKCWICRRPYHLKRNCTEIRCYYCYKKGHMKRDCHKKK